MPLDLEQLSPEELEKGMYFDREASAYRCIFCNRAFEAGEIFETEGRMFTPRRAAAEHLEREHPRRFEELLQAGGKYRTLTQHQAALMEMMCRGMSDREIAAGLGVSSATVRRQRFTFREKAKQAKLYLALYSMACSKAGEGGDLPVPIPSTAACPDERFDMTQGEFDKIIKSAFISENPLVLSHIPVKEKKKVAVLIRINREFESGRKYTEPEINEILKAVYSDYVTLRRYLIEYGFLDRTKNCSEYWKK